MDSTKLGSGKEVLSRLPGYKGANVQKRPKDAEKYASLTIQELERILVRHFVDHVNQHAYPRVAQARFERWESMIVEPLAGQRKAAGGYMI